MDRFDGKINFGKINLNITEVGDIVPAVHINDNE